MTKKTIDLDIPHDPAERARRQAEYDRMKAPLPDWLGPDTPERREDLQLFVQMMSEPAFTEESDYEPIDEDSPAILKGLVVMYRKRAELAEAERDEIKNLAPAHRAVVPVATMQAVATSVVKRVAELPGRSSPDDWPEAMLVTSDELHRIIMDELDGELG